MKTYKIYHVERIVQVSQTEDIEAESLEEAIEKYREMQQDGQFIYTNYEQLECDIEIKQEK